MRKNARVSPTYLIRYRHILVEISLTGVIYSVCEICTVPYWYVSDGDFVLFAVGPVQSGSFAQSLVLTFAISFFQSADWFRTFPQVVFICPFVNVLVLANWLVAVIYCFSMTEKKVEKAAEFVEEHLNMSIDGRAMLGFSLQVGDEHLLLI
uniref:Uncharacterized protein n=1 Tax=Caenorhabditis japonica TaxID=281687 RepID=A0A8R1HQF2_CAEJA